MRVLLLLLLQNLLAVDAFPVFTFSDTFYPPAPPSFASLSRNVELPDTFILCSSSKQARFDDLGFYTILGADGGEWLTIRFAQHPGAVILWASWDRNWYRLGVLKRPTLGFWYNICLELDMKYVQLTVAVNGEVMGKVEGRNITNTPETLRMDVGKWGLNEQQYQGRHAEKEK